MFELGQIIGKKVVAIRGFSTKKSPPKRVEPAYILFDDKETFLELKEQDYYNYHDCSISARIVDVVINPVRWEDRMENNNGYYPDATKDII